MRPFLSRLLQGWIPIVVIALLSGGWYARRIGDTTVGGAAETSNLEAAYHVLDGTGLLSTPITAVAATPPLYPLALAAGFYFTDHDARWVLALNLLLFAATCGFSFFY